MISIAMLSPWTRGSTVWPLLGMIERRERPTPHWFLKKLWFVQRTAAPKNGKILHQDQRAPLLPERRRVNLHGCSVPSVWMAKEVDRELNGLVHNKP